MNKKIKCTNNNCSDCQEWLKEKLAECEEWEIKRKASYRKFELRFCCNQDNEQNNIKDQNWYVETGGYNYHSIPCPSCQAITKTIKSNNHGDQTEELKECACQQSSSKHISATNTEREREREREKSNHHLL